MIVQQRLVGRPSAWLMIALAVVLVAGAGTAVTAQEPGVPVERVKKVVIQNEQGPGKAFLGVVPRPLDHVLRAALDFEEPGVLIAEVVPDGPAGKAGVKIGELLTKLNGKPIHDVDRLFALMNELKPGDMAEIQLHHKGKSRTIKVAVEDRPAPRFNWMGEGGELEDLIPGGMFFQGDDGESMDIKVEDLGGLGARRVKVITIGDPEEGK
jgi:hypothetical protein